jgi:poly-gamma-glutamate synthesis protein (capsule biosynthesis protein)
VISSKITHRFSGSNDTQVSVILAGDFYPRDPGVGNTGIDAYQRLSEDLSLLIKESDVSIVNLECPLTQQWNPIAKNGPVLRADPAWAHAIRAMGFDVASLANNHILDMGKPGLYDTLSVCREAGLHTVGAGNNLAEAGRNLTIIVHGIKIGILAFTEHEFSVATSTSAGANPVDPMQNYSQIQQAKENNDIVVCMLHGVNEFYPLPSPRMVKTCRFFVDAGADAIICHHTHVASGWETYKNAPIVYGTGNFLFDWAEPRPEDWYRGYLVSLSVSKKGLHSISLIPYQQTSNGNTIEIMNEIDAEAFSMHIGELSQKIMNVSVLEQEWERFCQSKKLQYLSWLLSLSRVERFLLRRGIWPSWRIRRQQVNTLFNMLACEAHHEVSNNVLHSVVADERSIK